MFAVKRPVVAATSPGLFGVGLLVGVAMLYIGILQGECCAAAINASKGKPAIFGISLTPAAIVEGFAVFAFVFALIVRGALPKGRGQNGIGPTDQTSGGLPVILP